MGPLSSHLRHPTWVSRTRFAACERPARPEISLPLTRSPAMRCPDNHLSRRNLLTVGAISGLGLTLADFFQKRALAEAKKYDFLEAKAQSVIHIFLPGGIAHQETFDPKPYAPIEYRGEMGVAKTNTNEVYSETLP